MPGPAATNYSAARLIDLLLLLLFIYLFPPPPPYVLVHSANVYKRMQWHVEQCSVAVLCN
jgi:hypothetical protein